MHDLKKHDLKKFALAAMADTRNRVDAPVILPRDYLQTLEGLIFAVVEFPRDNEPITGYLRYRQIHGDRIQKLSTATAFRLLQQTYPQYLVHCPYRDVQVQQIPRSLIHRHWSARVEWERILAQSTHSPAFKTLRRTILAFRRRAVSVTRLGLTGSLLLGVDSETSDVDLVTYDVATWRQVQAVFAEPRAPFRSLSLQDWEEAYARRQPELSLSEYVWHEQRKQNKGKVDGRKIDVTLCLPSETSTLQTWVKLGSVDIRARVTDDRQAFHWPAAYRLDHPDFRLAISYSATYAGQAKRGETVRIRGEAEENVSGFKRVVVGQSREAEGSYLKVDAPLPPGCPTPMPPDRSTH